MGLPPRTHNDYSVGIVCALPKEQTAAIALLDERHDDLPNPPHDDNAYTLGSMSYHNVVNSAATVATKMISTFPSIRFGLMVGIGGGAPPRVRLGDVVISVPTDGFPGVVQWDMGKTEKNETFRQTGRLNNPPNLLLTALTKLESKHSMEGSSISRHLEGMFLRYPRLASTYGRSDTLDDVCFRPDYAHIVVNSTQPSSNIGKKRNHEGQLIDTGANCRLCDPAYTLRCLPRDMVVHYGLIASGNQVIKDARVRDQTNDRLGGNILCFEMEAVGLMNSFPCAVIRGICDYCDSHKNKDWHEHAAAVAAAFAKELLGVIQVPRVSESSTAVEVIKSFSSTVSQIEEGVGIIRDSLSSVRSSTEEQLHTSIRGWLSPVDYEAIQADIYRNYQEGTGRWFLEDARFRAWMAGTASNPSQTLYVPESQRGMGIAFVYCSYERRKDQSADDLLASLLSQLAVERDILPPAIQSVYDKHSKGRSRPTRHAICQELHRIAAEFSVLYVIIDALDECMDERTRKDLMFEISLLQSMTDCRLMVTPDETDIQKYVRRHMAYLSRVAICRELENFGKGHESLAQAYNSAFMRVQNGLARSLLALLVCSKRILKADELLHALAVEPGTPYLDAKNLCNLEEIVSRCAGLVVHDQKAGNVRLVHTTARDYFQQRCSVYFPDGQEHLTSVCLTYLGYKAFKSGACSSDQAFVARKSEYPLLDYASRYWAEHYKDCEIAPDHLALSFLKDHMKVSAAMQALVMANPEFVSYRQGVLTGFMGVHLIAILGLNSLIHLLDNASLDSSDSYMRTPCHSNGATALHYAALRGHHKIVALLIKKGCDINCRDYGYGTPLTWAIDGGSVTTLKFLLQRNANTLSSILWPWKASTGTGDGDLEKQPESPFEDWDRGPEEEAKLSPYQVERRIFIPPIFQQIACSGEGALKDKVGKELGRIHQNDFLDALPGQKQNHSPSWITLTDDEGLPKHPWVLDDLFFNPLLRAVWKRNYRAIRLLLSDGCSPHFGNARGLTPTMLVDRINDATSKGILET
ncbi:hypothetical protein BJY01DRAFT_239253 [Aspergillus pseudoustus]|uniref:Nucleoside phosphorylase domain-containing protein n=1 Tax=Aspergillus pseudoustus TaxID=1810923 RepID=A0ABR4J227_9EURO